MIGQYLGLGNEKDTKQKRFDNAINSSLVGAGLIGAGQGAYLGAGQSIHNLTSGRTEKQIQKDILTNQSLANPNQAPNDKYRKVNEALGFSDPGNPRKPPDFQLSGSDVRTAKADPIQEAVHVTPDTPRAVTMHEAGHIAQYKNPKGPLQKGYAKQIDWANKPKKQFAESLEKPFEEMTPRRQKAVAETYRSVDQQAQKRLKNLNNVGRNIGHLGVQQAALYVTPEEYEPYAAFAAPAALETPSLLREADAWSRARKGMQALGDTGPKATNTFNKLRKAGLGSHLGGAATRVGLLGAGGALLNEAAEYASRRFGSEDNQNEGWF